MFVVWLSQRQQKIQCLHFQYYDFCLKNKQKNLYIFSNLHHSCNIKTMYVCRIAISKTTKGCYVWIFIVMTADDLVTGGPRASANIMFSEKKKEMCTVSFLFHSPTLNQ